MRKLLCVLALCAAVAPAATITPIHSIAAEPDLDVILDTVYGAGNYFRIDDDSDQVWQAGQITVRALATFAGAHETLGYCVVCDGSDDVLFEQTFDFDGIFSTPLTVGGSSILLIDTPFVWFDFAQFLPYVGQVYSDPSMNPGGADHLVTFGLNGQPNTFVLGFEDWLFGTSPDSDRDYQDFVVEVTYVGGPPDISTPEPGAMLTMLGGLAALFFIRRKRTAKG